MSDLNRAACAQRDAADSLASFRDAFVVPDGLIYLDGNSLGLMPKAAAERARQVVEQEWGQGLIRSWNTAGWWALPERMGDKVARLVGAEQGEVVVTDATGINLYKALSAGLQQVPDRRVILMEGSNFPTNNYMAQGLLAQLGRDWELRFVEVDDLPEALTGEVAIVCLTQVHYKTGRKLDLAAWTARIHAVGAIAIWDLCHSAGAFPVDLNGAGVDYAVGCTYKYLNGGPGGPGFVFAARRHHGTVQQPLTGWWSHAHPFAFERDYAPAPGIRQMLSGTQSILGLAVAEVGLDLFQQVDLDALQAKSHALTELFITLVEQRCASQGFALMSPRRPSERGSQVALAHENGYAIIQALIARGVIGDFRAPETVRFGFAPLYLRFVDVWDAVEQLVQVMAAGEDRDPRHGLHAAVT